MRLLVTGGAGYIGSVLVPMLLDTGHDVTVIDRFDNSQQSAALAACCRYSGFEPVRGDVRDERTMAELVPKHDVIIPLAALVGAPVCALDPISAVDINRNAVVALINRLAPGQMLLFPTTNSGYGMGEKDAYCTEDTPLRPISLYGTTKVEAERAILDSGNGISLRLATVFGMAPKMRVDLLVNDFALRAVRDRAVVIFEGHFRRNYIHIRDVARTFIHGIANYPSMNGRPYNVGLSDANLTKLQLCMKIKEQVPDFLFIEAPIGEDPDKRDYLVSNARIEATGFKPEVSIEAGITELVKGYRMLRVMNFTNV